MSIASELNNLEGNIEDSYDAVNDMGGIIPAQKNMDNLDQAIRTIPQSQGTTYTAGYGIDIDQNDEISVDTSVIAEKTDIPTNTSDLTNDGDDGAHPFIATDDYATNQTAGAVKVTSSFGVEMSNSGEIKGAVVSSADYPSMWNDAIVSKGTLENALSTKSYATTSDIPTNTSDLANDGSDGTSTYVEADDLATVATSGLYSDLTGTPTIPAAQVNSDWNANSGVEQILNKPSLATVATSGSYTDLSNKPTIPTVNNATLTIQKNGTTVKTFTANASSDVTCNISVPTQFSNLSGTVSTSQIAGSAVTSAKIDWGNCRTFGTGTLNSTYFSSGTVQWTKLGNMVFVVGFDMALSASPPNNSWTTYAISNLPKAASSIGNYKFNATRYGTNNLNLTLAIKAGATGLYFHYTAGTQTGTFNLLAVYAAA